MEKRLITNRYRLEHLIGRGGMGAVWVAFDLQLHRSVAIKLMQPEQGVEKAPFRNLLAHEARAIAQFQHPNVMQIFDYGIDTENGEDLPYLVMELLTGEDLQARLQRLGRLPLEVLTPLLVQVCRALSTAHSAGLVHRDLKPANLFLARGDGKEVLKVLDFGVAAMRQFGPIGLDIDGAIVGTPHYMSPEQVCDPSQVDSRSDLYSLGVVAYEALTGKLPIQTDYVTEVISILIADHQSVIPPSQHVPSLSAAVDRFFARALARDPGARFQSAREFTAAFMALTREESRRAIKVLIVDDEPDVEFLFHQRLSEQIEQGKYEFFFADNGMSAMEKIRLHPELDLILTDIRMPGMDGLALLNRITEEHPFLKVVIVSAYGDMDNIREAMNKGAFDFLIKPIDFKDLEQTVQRTAQHVSSMRRSAAWAEENTLLRMFASGKLIERLLPMLPAEDVMLCELLQATILFIRGEIPTSLMAQTPDATIHSLNTTFEWLFPVIQIHGGIVEEFVAGGALIAFRGAEHTERATRASLAICSPWRNQETKFAADSIRPQNLTIGLDVGSVIYGTIGAISQRRVNYTLLGEPVLNAMNLAAHAKPGQIVVLNALRQAMQPSHEFKLLGSWSLAEGAEIHDIYQLLPSSSVLVGGSVDPAHSRRALNSTAPQVVAGCEPTLPSTPVSPDGRGLTTSARGIGSLPSAGTSGQAHDELGELALHGVDRDLPPMALHDDIMAD